MENAQPEPSMEEILASIRRIISEDEEETPEAEIAPVPVPAQPAPAESHGAHHHTETEDIEMVNKSVAEAVELEADEEILEEGVANAASSAFANLSASVKIANGPGKSLEELVVDMLRPMVKDWLNANLPVIVEEKVEAEVGRVARRRR